MSDFTISTNQTTAAWMVDLVAATKPAMLRAALTAGSQELLTVVKRYPPRVHITRASVYGQTFASDKQRRWFFASLNDGSLTLPYRRSMGLGQSWTFSIESNTRAVVGTNVGYARLVKGQGDQSAFLAASGWQTVNQDAAKASPKVLAAIDTVIRKALGI